MERIKEFYLVEVNKYGEESALMQNYSNGFTRGGTPNNAYKFQEKEQVMQACKVQNMLATILNNGTKTYFVEQNIEREMYDENGEVYVKDEMQEV